MCMEKGLSEWIAMTNSRKMWYDMIVNEGNIKVNLKKRFKNMIWYAKIKQHTNKPQVIFVFKSNKQHINTFV